MNCIFPGGAKGNRTPDLLDANESRYQLRHSPWSVAGYQPTPLLLAGRPRQIEATPGVGNLVEVLECRVLVVDVERDRPGPMQS